jgi:hypothetical protein
MGLRTYGEASFLTDDADNSSDEEDDVVAVGPDLSMSIGDGLQMSTGRRTHTRVHRLTHTHDQAHTQTLLVLAFSINFGVVCICMVKERASCSAADVMYGDSSHPPI